jgi:hypothetical protein
MIQLRQGDVLLTRCKQPTLDGGACVEHSKSIVLAEGEVTGHAHRVRSMAAMALWLIGAKRYIEVIQTATIKHEEHGKIDLDPGWYEVRRQREFDAGRVRWVAD